MTVLGQEITKNDIELVRRIIDTNPSRNRTWISKEPCLLWNWHATNGYVKNIAYCSFLLKVDTHGHSPVETLPFGSLDIKSMRCQLARSPTVTLSSFRYSQCLPKPII